MKRIWIALILLLTLIPLAFYLAHVWSIAKGQMAKGKGREAIEVTAEYLDSPRRRK